MRRPRSARGAHGPCYHASQPDCIQTKQPSWDWDRRFINTDYSGTCEHARSAGNDQPVVTPTSRQCTNNTETAGVGNEPRTRPSSIGMHAHELTKRTVPQMPPERTHNSSGETENTVDESRSTAVNTHNSAGRARVAAGRERRQDSLRLYLQQSRTRVQRTVTPAAAVSQSPEPDDRGHMTGHCQPPRHSQGGERGELDQEEAATARWPSSQAWSDRSGVLDHRPDRPDIRRVTHSDPKRSVK